MKTSPLIPIIAAIGAIFAVSCESSPSAPSAYTDQEPIPMGSGRVETKHPSEMRP